MLCAQRNLISSFGRAPELLLGETNYTTAIDMWSVGCIFAELVNKEPLFQGRGEMDQLAKIMRLLGTPTVEKWPGLRTLMQGKTSQFIKQPYSYLDETFPNLTQNGRDLLARLLTYDPSKRISAEEALKHPYFRYDMFRTYKNVKTNLVLVRHPRRKTLLSFPPFLQSPQEKRESDTTRLLLLKPIMGT